MSIDKIQADCEAEAFRDIGQARHPKELHAIAALIDAITPDEDCRAELRRQIALKFGEWNLAAMPDQKPRWNFN